VAKRENKTTSLHRKILGSIYIGFASFGVLVSVMSLVTFSDPPAFAVVLYTFTTLVCLIVGYASWLYAFRGK
jgi:hypothetical protein